ncbi:MAG: SRPBCC domain-containing protein [Rhizobiaceae bacterium]|nr:SRPBCC domain-containing protein [Rhizobiaceae bacterium]
MINAKPSAGASLPQAAVVVERLYHASVEELWALWTTKAGFESWWGPEGFRVEVHVLEPREGGALEYDMIADAPEAIAAMQAIAQPISHSTRGRYAEFRPGKRLKLVHVIDFIAGQEPYESVIDVAFSTLGEDARMVVTLHPHIDPHWTKMSAEGFGSQLAKLDRRFGWTEHRT